VTNFIKGLTDINVSSITAKIACIGPKTSDTAIKAGLKVDILARKQTIEGLVQSMEDYYLKEA